MVEKLSIYKIIIKNISKVINSCKRIVWYREKACDVLIYDAEGSDYLLHCIPAHSNIFIIRNRTEEPLFISAKFFLFIILELIKSNEPRSAIMAALVKHLNPKVIITFIDNSPTICLIKKICPSIPMFIVQNGTRWDFSIKDRGLMEYDHYFGFGLVEADIFAQGGHTVSSFYPIGSIRTGIFRDEKFDFQEKVFDLCYISQFDPIPLNCVGIDKWTLELLTAYYDVGKKHFDVIVKYAIENKLSLCVAMRSASNGVNYADELEYFISQNHDKITYISQSKFSSYTAVQASRLTFTISSTLGYEALGWGERVIFAKDVEPVNSLVTQGSWTDNLVTHRLPELQRLYSLDYAELCFKATEMLKMKNQDYINYSKGARSYYMNYDDERKPQTIIRKKISELI